MSNYRALRPSKEEIIRHSPEHKLWQGVVWQAIRDAYRFDGDESEKAIRWLCDGGEDAQEVFENAGIDGDYIDKRIKTIVYLLAHFTVRGKEAHWSYKTRKVQWRKPIKKKRECAKRFLMSPTGRMIYADIDLPADETERKRMIGSAIAISRSQEVVNDA